MPDNTSSRSPPPSAEPDETPLSSSPPSEPRLTTPGRECPAHSAQANATPPSLGSSICQEDETDQAEGYHSADYERYIREDLHGRVFVEFEVFMQHVLHVPDNWKSEWGSAIEAARADPDFKRSLEEYCEPCVDSNSDEESFYDPLTDAVNAVLAVVSRETFEGISSRIPQNCGVTNPNVCGANS